MKRKTIIFIVAFTFIFGAFASRSMAATYSLANLSGTWAITVAMSVMDDDDYDELVIDDVNLVYLPIKISSTGAVSSGGTGYVYIGESTTPTTAYGTLKATGGTLKISTAGVVSGTIKIKATAGGESQTITAYVKYGMMNTGKTSISGLMIVPSDPSYGTFTATKR